MLVVSLVAILGVAGLAVDVGNAFLVQTRLQNAMDAAALSAAKTLNQHRSTVRAKAHGTETFIAHLNADLSDYAGSITPVFEFSDALTPFETGGLNSRFVRVSLTDVPVAVLFANALSGVSDQFDLDSAAVAGPLPIGGGEAEICDVAPLFVCGDMSDSDCSDGTCYGMEIGDESEVCLKTGSQNGGGNGNGNGNGNGLGNWKGQNGDDDGICSEVSPGIGSGNFQLLSLGCGNGANCVRQAISGAYRGCLTLGNDVETKPGNTVGPTAQGLNTRFGEYSGSMTADAYPPDLVTTNRNDDSDFWYRNYLDRYVNGIYDEESGRPNRRVVAVPVGSCDGTVNGRGTVTVSAVACVFLTRPALHSGNDQAVYGQIIGDCEVGGDSPAEPQTGPTLGTFGAYKIVLYKNAGATDA